MFLKNKKNKGFTLVELIIVVAILAILVGLLAPQYTKYVEKTRKSADINNLNEIVNAIKIAATDPDYNLGSKTKSITEYRVAFGKIYIGSDQVDGIEVQRFSGDDDDQIEKVLKEYCGLNLNSIQYIPGADIKRFFNDTMKVKSNKWGEGRSEKELYDQNFWATTSGIGARIALDNSTGSITVIYTDNVDNYLDHGTIDPQ